MCIRDSAKDNITVLNEMRVPVNKPVIAYISSKDVIHSFKAVSYTHLRAHETVLDLVCRLLLEKKKTSLQSSSHA